MSLINDALKRAKQAQNDTPPPSPSNLQFRPVEHGHLSRPQVGLAVPVLLGFASLVLLVMLWQTARERHSAEPIEVKARTAVPVTPAAGPSRVSDAAPSGATASVPAAPSVSSATSAPISKVAPETIAGAAATNIIAYVAVDPGDSNTTAPAVASAPKPVLPKLQGIVYSPVRPSVLINGKTLFLGDKLGEFRVRAIDAESVTLVSASQTNILTLEQ